MVPIWSYSADRREQTGESRLGELGEPGPANHRTDRAIMTATMIQNIISAYHNNTKQPVEVEEGQIVITPQISTMKAQFEESHHNPGGYLTGQTVIKKKLWKRERIELNGSIIAVFYIRQ